MHRYQTVGCVSRVLFQYHPSFCERVTPYRFDLHRKQYYSKLKPSSMITNKMSDIGEALPTKNDNFSSQGDRLTSEALKRTIPSLSTLLIHADAEIDDLPDVSCPIRVSTTYHQGNDSGLAYSRIQTSTTMRVESVIGSMLDGQAVAYSSGLAATAALINNVRPRTILLEAGYHGTRQLANMLTRDFQDSSQSEITDQSNTHTTNPRIISYEQSQRMSPKQQKTIDLIIVEIPQNPYGTVPDFTSYVKLKEDTGATLAIDATMATPLGLDGFGLGCDVIMHASTKYLGGHSDLLGGVLICRDEQQSKQLLDERILLGSVMGNLESFLLLRSLRTLELRVKKQSTTALTIAKWLAQPDNKRKYGIREVWHPLIPDHPSHVLAVDTLKVPPPTLSITLQSEEHAKHCARSLNLFHEATSLGGVESLVDWRYQWDKEMDPSLLRLSIGLEDVYDLIKDLDRSLLYNCS